MFRDFNYDNNLPIDGLPLYAEKIWGVIRNHKDLNLPSQKVMVSNLRCSQIKMDAIDLIREDLAQLRSRTLKDIHHSFGSEGHTVLHKAVGFFEENAHDYSKEVFQDKGLELKKHVLNELFQLYEAQVHNLKKTVFAEFSRKLDRIQMEKGRIDQVLEGLRKDKGEAVAFAQSVLYKSVVLENEWSLEVAMEEIRETLDNQEKGYIEKLVTLFIKLKESQIKKSMNRNINALFDNLDVGFWARIRENFRENMESSEKDIIASLKGSFEMSEATAEGYLQLIVEEVFGSLQFEIAAKTSDLNHYLNKR